MERDFAQDHSCPSQQPGKSLFVCKHKQVQPSNIDALVRGGLKPLAGTLQAMGAGFKKQPHVPKRAALFMDTECSRHREERPGEEAEGLAGLDAHCPRPSSTQCLGNSDTVLTVVQAELQI